MPSRLDARHDFVRRFGIPKQWREVCLGDIAEVVGGGTPGRDEGRYWQGGDVPWATPTDLTALEGKILAATSECITPAGLRESAARLLPRGSVLYTSRATIGAKAIAAIEVATNQGFASFVPNDVNGEYLYYLLDLLTPIIKRLGAGTTFDEVSKRDIRKVRCALPTSPAEQAAIARVLDAVDAAIDRAREAQIEAARLKTALTQQLFTEGIRRERRKKTALGWIPASWEVKPVSAVVTQFEYGLSMPMHLKGATPILRMGNIQRGDVVMDELKYVTLSQKLLDRYRLNRGDVLFNRTNSQEHVGKIGIYRSDEPAVFASYLIRLHPDATQVDNYFLGQLLNSYPIQCRIKRYATPGVQQVNINAKNLGKVLIPIPIGPEGLDEQREIAKLLEQADERCRAPGPVVIALEQLKKSLTYDLLTGTVRVDPALVREPNA